MQYLCAHSRLSLSSLLRVSERAEIESSKHLGPSISIDVELTSPIKIAKPRKGERVFIVWSVNKSIPIW